MKIRYYGYYFVVAKFAGLFAAVSIQLAVASDGLMQKCIHFLVMALFLATAVMIELADESKKKIVFLTGEGILAVTGVFLFPVTGILLLTICFLDGISLFRKEVPYYALIYLILLPAHRCHIDLLTAIWVLSLLLVLYIQEKVVMEKYRSIIDENEQTEGTLKHTMEKSSRAYQEEISRSHLRFENQMLEERGRITQALHDKLGHSINGSLYKLEAAKLLLRARPQESEKNLQEVIDNLRGCMDEIRMILRSERPDKKRMAVLSLQSFCEDCEEQYHIGMHLNMGEGSGEIPEQIWEIIVDNTFEAVTNALKYAQCRNITIDILPLNGMVRCTVRDDGKGASYIEEGMGLAGMKKRVRSVQGVFDVDTNAGMGFTINMLLPYKTDGGGYGSSEDYHRG